MKISSLFATLILLVILVLTTVLYTVDEGQRALVIRLGEVVTDAATGKPAAYGPGLHAVIPFIEKVRKIDVRIQELASAPFSVLSSQQTFLSVDYYAKWRITDLALFYTSTNRGDMRRAQQLLEQNINDIIRAAFGTNTSNQTVSVDREAIMQEILRRANALDKIKEMGISIIDIRLRSVLLPDRVLKSVFARMASERKQFAENARAEGNRIAEGIRALADQKAIIIKASATAEAAQIRATGDQQAAEIYAKTYNQDADFYRFYRSLELYQQAFSNKNDILVLQPDSPLFNYFNHTAARQ